MQLLHPLLLLQGSPAASQGTRTSKQYTSAHSQLHPTAAAASMAAPGMLLPLPISSSQHLAAPAQQDILLQLRGLQAHGVETVPWQLLCSALQGCTDPLCCCCCCCSGCDASQPFIICSACSICMYTPSEMRGISQYQPL
jgi:hypothetical protein